MWTISDIKQRAKGLFKANYWKAVLAAIVLSIIAGGGVSSGGTGAAFSGMQSAGAAGAAGTAGDSYGYTFGTLSAEDPDFSPYLEEYDDIDTIPPIPGLEDLESTQDPDVMGSLAPVLIAAAGLVIVIILIILVLAILTDVLLLNPLEVGVRRFYSVNLYEPARIREIAFGFDHSYKNIVKTMFFRDLYTILWSLLFIIPGIIKSYEYRMIPYLLAEYPDMPKEDSFAISKYMMSGNKWKTFVLDLSFILWFLGTIVTLGLLGLFYTNPYYAQSGAVLYDVLKAEKQPFARNSAPEMPVLPPAAQE